MPYRNSLMSPGKPFTWINLSMAARTATAPHGKYVQVDQFEIHMQMGYEAFPTLKYTCSFVHLKTMWWMIHFGTHFQVDQVGKWTILLSTCGWMNSESCFQAISLMKGEVTCKLDCNETSIIYFKGLCTIAIPAVVNELEKFTGMHVLLKQGKNTQD